MPYKKSYARKPTTSYTKRRPYTPKKAGRKVPTAPYGFKGSYYRSGKELKFLDRDQRVDDVGVVGSGTFANCSKTGTIHFISGIGQGTAMSDRIGREVWLKSVQLRFNIQIGSPTVPALVSDHVRVIIFSDRSQNGEATSVTHVLETADYASLTSMKNGNRIWIHHDKLISLSSNGERSFSYNVYIKLNRKLVFGGENSAIASMQSNGLHVLVINTTSLDTPTAYSFGARIRYTDA